MVRLPRRSYRPRWGRDFFMGNKDVDGKTVLAGGVEEEFKIAEEMNLSVLPIGASGWMAKAFGIGLLLAGIVIFLTRKKN